MDGVFSTADMYLAALLLAKDFHLLGTDNTDPKHIHFRFAVSVGPDDGSALEDVVRNHTNGVETVNSSRFMESIRKIKALIHAR